VEVATIKSGAVPPATPVMERLAAGVDDPTPTLPFCRIVKSEVPVEDATLNGLTPAEPWRLKVMVAEVALIPATVPLSMKRPAVRSVADVQRAERPIVPVKEEADASPSDEVAIQRVEVPVDQRICPRVPEALVTSRSVPWSVRLVEEVAFVRKAPEL
jgi:hypothetical protein